MSSDRDAAMRRTSELLLGGWKMLSMGCPICHTALMEKNNSKCCPRCNLPVHYEHEKPASATAAAPPPPPTSQALSPSPLSSPKQSGQFQSLEEVKKSYDKLQVRQQLVSSRIGEKLLAGWTLLASECDVCGSPLMSQKGVKYCVCCETNKDDKKAVGPSAQILAAPVAAAGAVSSLKAESKTEAISASAQLLENIPLLSEDEATGEEDFLETLSAGNGFDSLEEASQLISEKMVLGWSLLQDVCEGACEGNVPLLKDPKKGQVALTSLSPSHLPIYLCLSLSFSLCLSVSLSLSLSLCLCLSVL
jgi:uncharacterized Zn finger protein (UPF0148 family)